MSRIDPATNRVSYTVPAGRGPAGLTIADGGLWVADAGGAVLRLDPHTGGVADRLRIGSSPVGLAAARGSVWVPAAPALAAHRGGTLRVGAMPLPLDPADASFSPAQAVSELAYDSLVAYRRAGGAAGARPVGELAAEVPKPTESGRRYVFRLRPGLRYSDGRRVKAGDFRASLERTLVISGDLTAPLFDAIGGVASCRTAPRRCDLSRSVAADERSGTITIRLRRPDPDFLPKLKFIAVVPADTPRRLLEARLPPGTGPYRIERLVPRRRALLTRNPHFQPRGPDGRPDGFADRVEVAMGPESAQVAAVERGRLDLATVFATATTQRLAALRTRLGSRLRSAAAAFTEYAWLNVKAPPFDDPRVRRALNLAVDRRRVVDLTGGPDAASPTCQLLPPGLPGYRPICPFTVAPSSAGAWTAPDPAGATRLVAAAGARGTPVEVFTWRPRRSVARHLAHVLRALGFPSRVRVFGRDNIGPSLKAATDRRQRPQIGLNGWLADSPEPGMFLRSLVSCGAEFNLSRFCDHKIDAAIDGAEDAGASWQRIERRIALQAPVVPLTTRRSIVVTSHRTGNVQFQSLTPSSGPGLLLDQVWVR